MKLSEKCEYDVLILRPLLFTEKKDIYQYAKYYKLPHL